ncbi:MAG: hypothetical protein C0601_02765 [Candidatus Muiribacterium halophilum]|uniref:Uncharacterized protein n=1 Tax=Muiribacterium halophilum TaxID=2053465 RepID=A0A2N5ZKH6_MUIH1|nr:MAG: hypothetical protein C0601_02765 [Candidatus Muirbacterium halophilum]
MKKKLLILGVAPNLIIDKNFIEIEKRFNREKFEYNLLVTKNYKNELVDKYVGFPNDFIKENMIFDFSGYDKIIVCQCRDLRTDFLNVYLFLKNNGVTKTNVIYNNNKIGVFNLKRLNKLNLYLYKFLSFYKKLGF